MPVAQKLLLVLLTLVALSIGTAIAIDKHPDAPEPNVSSEELVGAARSAYEINSELYKGPRNTPEDVYVWSKRWMTTERDLNLAAGEGTKAVKAHLERMVELEALTKTHSEHARAPGGAVAAARYYRTEAELMVARTGD